MKPIIEFNQFTFQYKQLASPTLKNINLTIYEGEKVLIAGPSGCGKSTLAHCINGLIPFAKEGTIEGSLTVGGKHPYKESIFEISKLVGTILQDQDGQFIGLSVGEDVAFALENDNVPVEKMHEYVEEALEYVDMGDFIHRSPHALSGGQKQRVSLAGVLAMQSPILLFDEPLANLDPVSAQKVVEIMDYLHESQGKTVVVVEHRIEDILEKKVDKVVLMNDGEIVFIGTPLEVIQSGLLRKNGIREPLYIEALRQAGVDLSGEIKSDPYELRVDTLDIAYYEEALKNHFKTKDKPAPHVGKRILSLEYINFEYEKGQPLIKNLNCEIHEGEIVALLGNNGAGKSTLSNLITGILKPSKGRICLDCEDVTHQSIGQRAKKIGYVMQNPNHMITQNMIREELEIGLLGKGYSKEEIDRRVIEALTICGLEAYKNWPVSALSYGQKKRLSIASILITGPKVLILDEPTAGQDYNHYKEFMDFVAELAKQGLTIIFITHDMYLALEYTDRAIVLSNGRKIADNAVISVLSNQELLSRANLRETSLSQLGRAAGIEDINGLIYDFIETERKVGEYA